MDIQKKKDQEYLVKREKKLPKITKNKSSRHLVDNFPKYANRHEIAYFLARNFLFEKILNTRGSVIAFDELNHHKWPGETLTFLDGVNCNKIELKTVEYMPRISYAIL